ATQRRQWMAIRDELIAGDPHVVIDRFVELLPEPDDETYDGTDMEGVVAKHAACTHPFVDGVRQEIGARSRALGDLWVPVSRQVPLQIMDKVWRGHLQMLDHLRDAVGLRGTTGTSLPVLFTLEASRLFEDTITNAAVDVCAALSWVR